MTARVMRRVLVDLARAQRNQKRGGALQRITFDCDLPAAFDTPVNLIAVDEALEALTGQHPRKGKVVDLRFFAGLSVEETAEALGVSQETVSRDWRLAKSWLLRELSRQPAQRVIA